MIVEYGLDLGMHRHEVLADATVDDIIYYMAVKSLQYQEEKSAARRAAVRAKHK